MHSKHTAGLMVVIFLLSITSACQQTSPAVAPVHSIATNENPFHSIAEIPAPAGFKRIKNGKETFAAWLEQVGLKKDKTVYLYNGIKKTNQTAQFAVLDIPIENKDLQQCADAVMRLRATYVFDNKKFDEINFRDNDGRGYLFSVPYTYDHFKNYLERVFGMCGTASLAKQLYTTDFDHLAAGDVLIRGGFPGHAVIVVDIVVNDKGQKKYLLAQSYMPAQDIHILLNPENPTSPWYDVNENNIIATPEYTFYRHELKKW